MSDAVAASRRYSRSLFRSGRRALSWLPPAQLLPVEAMAQRFVQPILRSLRPAVDPSRAAVDVGGYRGSYAYWLARWAPQVFVFEPNPPLAEWLRRGLPAHCHVFEAAVSSTAKVGQLHIPLTPEGPLPSRASLLGVDGGESVAETVSVECLALDALSLPPVGFIKVDVEGAEMDVIEGARELILRDRPALLVEIEERWTSLDPIECVRTIEGLGYRGRFFFAGAWQPAASFVVETHQRAFRQGASSDYGNNFLFLPAGTTG